MPMTDKFHDKFHIVLCTCPDQATARKIATILLEKQQCACVNILPGVESIYKWQGKIESSEEYLIIIKSIKEAYPAIEQLILTNHPYELPEIIAVSIETGLPNYLSWIKNNVEPNVRTT